MSAVQFTSPIGRLVSGSLSEAKKTNPQGAPLINKNGEQRSNYYFAIAIPKNGSTHWNQTAWGQTIFNTAAAGFPGKQYEFPHFAWKITDGDSTVPNKKGKIPNQIEGYIGCWVLHFSSDFAPKLWNYNTKEYINPGFINPGDYIQVAGTIVANGRADSPGIYLNHQLVAFIAYGQRISFSPDPNSVGFGGELPVGASMTPVGGMTNVPQTSQMLHATPAQSYAPLPTNPAAVPPVSQQTAIPQAYPTVAPAPAAIPPHTAILNGVKPKVMTPAAQGIPYETYITGGYTDEMLVKMGLMLPV
jgi:hypothetical protein